MGEAWIIDAVRTPRGKGKKETGALSEIHPQALLAQCLVALQSRNGFDPNHVEDLDRRLRVGRQRSGRLHRAQRGARRGLGCPERERRHAQPLLRLRPAGGELRRDGRHGRPAGSGDRRRRRVDVARADGLDRRRSRRQQPRTGRAAPAGAAGHLGGSDRDTRGVHARRPRSLRSAEPGALRDRTEGRPLREEPRPGARSGGQGRARSRRVPARGHLGGVARQARAVLRGTRRLRAEGRHAHARPARAVAATRRSPQSTTSTTRATRRASSTARARCWWRRRNTRRRTTSRRARASSRPRRPPTSRSSC